MSLKNDVLDISVCDNGCGFQHVSQDGGYGLTTMKQRMENIGGECSIESTPGHGSAIRLRLRLQSIYKRK
jgi:signal transduction histidine kinase